jgi:tetratricopeptide (TPR) repeat protein
MAALDAGEAAGGDARGKQSGGILIVKPIGDSGRTTDRWVDVRVDDHATPFLEIRRLMNMQVSRNQAGLARDHAEAGRMEEAVRAQRKAVALAPEQPQYLFGLSELYARAGDRGQALATLSLAIDRDPQWGERALASEAFAGLRNDGEFRRLVGR